MAKKSVKQQKGGNKTETPVETPVEAVVEEITTTPPPLETEQTLQEGGEGVQTTQKGGSDSKKRTFKIKLEDDKFCSRITGNTPKQAASKALTLLINQKKQNGKSIKGKVQFTIRETTRGSKGKEYTYLGEKVKLKQPTTYSIRSANGEVKEIVNKFKNVIEKFQG